MNLEKVSLQTFKGKNKSYGVESLSFSGSFPWNTIDDSIKQEPTLALSKSK